MSISIKLNPAPARLRPGNGTFDRWITADSLRNRRRVGNRKPLQMALALPARTLYLRRQQMGA
jgi:hypothetical protein